MGCDGYGRHPPEITEKEKLITKLYFEIAYIIIATIDVTAIITPFFVNI